MKITVTMRAVDGCFKSKTFKTLAGAQKFAQRYVGTDPEICSSYAVSADGVCRITVDGVSLQDLFTPAGRSSYTVADAKAAVEAGKFAILEDFPRYGNRDEIIGHQTSVVGVYGTRREFDAAWKKVEAAHKRDGSYEYAYWMPIGLHEPVPVVETVVDSEIPF